MKGSIPPISAWVHPLTYRVGAGDTPGSIAEKWTGRRDLYWQLVGANLHKMLGPPPCDGCRYCSFGELFVGEKLFIPTSWQVPCALWNEVKGACESVGGSVATSVRGNFNIGQETGMDSFPRAWNMDTMMDVFPASGVGVGTVYQPVTQPYLDQWKALGNIIANAAAVPGPVQDMTQSWAGLGFPFPQSGKPLEDAVQVAAQWWKQLQTDEDAGGKKPPWGSYQNPSDILAGMASWTPGEEIGYAVTGIIASAAGFLSTTGLTPEEANKVPWNEVPWGHVPWGDLTTASQNQGVAVDDLLSWWSGAMGGKTGTSGCCHPGVGIVEGEWTHNDENPITNVDWWKEVPNWGYDPWDKVPWGETSKVDWSAIDSATLACVAADPNRLVLAYKCKDTCGWTPATLKAALCSTMPDPCSACVPPPGPPAPPPGPPTPPPGPPPTPPPGPPAPPPPPPAEAKASMVGPILVVGALAVIATAVVVAPRWAEKRRRTGLGV